MVQQSKTSDGLGQAGHSGPGLEVQDTVRRTAEADHEQRLQRYRDMHTASSPRALRKADHPMRRSYGSIFAHLSSPDRPSDVSGGSGRSFICFCNAVHQEDMTRKGTWNSCPAAFSRATSDYFMQNQTHRDYTIPRHTTTIAPARKRAGARQATNSSLAIFAQPESIAVTSRRIDSRGSGE